MEENEDGVGLRCKVKVIYLLAFQQGSVGDAMEACLNSDTFPKFGILEIHTKHRCCCRRAKRKVKHSKAETNTKLKELS